MLMVKDAGFINNNNDRFMSRLRELLRGRAFHT